MECNENQTFMLQQQAADDGSLQ